MAHTRVTTFHDDGSVTVADAPENSYRQKRGKVTPQAKASWGQRTGMNQEYDPTLAHRVLDEALGD